MWDIRKVKKITMNPQSLGLEIDLVVGKGRKKEGQGQVTVFLLGRTSLRNLWEGSMQ